jgi:iron complex transport system ATP-binding protein
VKKKPLLEFRDVTLVRSGRTVLDGLTLRIGVGENVAILGPNGSGKSSFVSLLTRDRYPSVAGRDSSLHILGRDHWKLFDLRKLLGIVTPDLQHAFDRELTAWDAVLSGFTSGVGLWVDDPVTTAMLRKAHTALEKMEIPHLADRLMTEMSTGEARRVLIARALVHAPRALVLDEPLSSLDLRAARELRATIGRLARSGTSVVMVTHHLEDVIPEIKRVILLRAGRVFRDGPKREVLTDANLTALFGLRLRVVARDGHYSVI